MLDMWGKYLFKKIFLVIKCFSYLKSLDLLAIVVVNVFFFSNFSNFKNNTNIKKTILLITYIMLTYYSYPQNFI